MTTDNSKYILLDHTADLGIKIWGNDPKNLFTNAGIAFRDLICRGKTLAKTKPFTINLFGKDYADLLVRWLGEILYYFEVENLILTSFDIQTLTEDRFKAKVDSMPFDPNLHKIIYTIKAVTYHQVEVIKDECQWVAKVFMDL